MIELNNRPVQHIIYAAERQTPAAQKKGPFMGNTGPLLTHANCSIWHASGLAAVSVLPRRQGYGHIDSSSNYEFDRLIRGGALLILYVSSAVVIRDSYRTRPIQLMQDEIETEQEVEQCALLF